MIRLNLDFGSRGMYFESEKIENGIKGVYSIIDDVPFELLGIHSKKIREEVQAINGKDFGEAIAQVKVGQIVKDANGGEFAHLCESIIFDELVRKYIGEVIPKVEISPSAPKIKGKMIFVSDSKEWVIVKKVSVTNETTAREAAAFLLGVKTAVLSKYLSLRYPDRNKAMEEMAKKLKGKRKSLTALREVYEFSDNGRDVCMFIEGAALLGYSLTPNQDAIKEAFPELKLPGLRGRMPKG